MQLGEVKEVSEVSATVIAVQMDSAVVGRTIDSKTVNDLPLNGRTFAQLATLVPGVAAQGSLNIGTQRQRGSIGTAFAITANGFSDVQNNFIYDGEPAMDLDSYDFAFSPSRPRTESGRTRGVIVDIIFDVVISSSASRSRCDSWHCSGPIFVESRFK